MLRFNLGFLCVTSTASKSIVSRVVSVNQRPAVFTNEIWKLQKNPNSVSFRVPNKSPLAPSSLFPAKRNCKQTCLLILAAISSSERPIINPSCFWHEQQEFQVATVRLHLKFLADVQAEFQPTQISCKSQDFVSKFAARKKLITTGPQCAELKDVSCAATLAFLFLFSGRSLKTKLCRPWGWISYPVKAM